MFKNDCDELRTLQLHNAIWFISLKLKEAILHIRAYESALNRVSRESETKVCRIFCIIVIRLIMNKQVI